MKRQRLFSRILSATLLLSCLGILASCNVTRVVETKSEYFTKGDTTCTIVTKTVESYDASKKAF